MASQGKIPVIITPENIGEGKRIVQQLINEPLISVDSEGVNLGKDGPLTLLQIGTLDGNVFLFDVMVNEKKQDKSFFKRTGIDKLLSSTKIVKVIHSCSGDSAALYHQFGIRLENVFDTQVAHLVIEEHKGRQLPIRLKLADMCEHYSENAEVFDKKDDLKMIWSKLVGNFWAKRPMTADMIKYASSDVTALIPDVYSTQKRYIEDNDLCDVYSDRVLEEIELDIDPAQKERRRERNKERRDAVLSNMDKKYPRSVTFEEISDPDERKAIDDSYPSEIEGFSDKIMNLKQGAMVTYLDNLDEELKDTEQFNPERSAWHKLGEIERFGRETSKTRASALKKQLVTMVIKDIDMKYSPATDIGCLSSLDRIVLNSLQPTGKDKVSSKIFLLHFKLVEYELDDEIEKHDKDSSYEIHISFGKLDFFIKNDKVPDTIKLKAAHLKGIAHKRMINSIARKYNAATDVDDLTWTEKDVLRNLQVRNSRYHSTIIALHWKITYEKLCEDCKQLKSGQLRMNDGFRRKLNFLKGNPSVPANVKQKAIEVLSQF
ncbi:piRNA metabolic process [Mactra antiquata]